VSLNGGVLVTGGVSKIANRIFLRLLTMLARDKFIYELFTHECPVLSVWKIYTIMQFQKISIHPLADCKVDFSLNS